MGSFKRKLTSFLSDSSRFLQYGDLPTSYYLKKGMKIGSNFCRQGSTKFDITNCYLISFGNDVTVANNVQFLAHDDTTIEDLDYRKVGKITVGNNVFFGARSLVLMNTKIGDNVIVAAGSVVTKDIPDNCVVAGVPAKVISSTSDYMEKNRKLMSEKKVFDVNYSVYGDFTQARKQELIDATQEDFVFVKIKKFSKGE